MVGQGASLQIGNNNYCSSTRANATSIATSSAHILSTQRASAATAAASGASASAFTSQAATAAATIPASSSVGATASAEAYAVPAAAIQPALRCDVKARGVYDDTIVTDIRDALEHASCGIKLQSGAFHTVYYDPEVCAPNQQRSSLKLKVIEASVAADGSKSPLVAIVSEGTCTVARHVDRSDGDDVVAASRTLGPSVAHTWLVCSCGHAPVTVTPLSVIRD
jgi:hypothetical protein